MIGRGQRLARDCHSHCLVPYGCLLVPARTASPRFIFWVNATTSPRYPKGASRRRHHIAAPQENCAGPYAALLGPALPTRGRLPCALWRASSLRGRRPLRVASNPKPYPSFLWRVISFNGRLVLDF